MENADIILNLTNNEVVTILTALKMETYRAQNDGNAENVKRLSDTVSAIVRQPWTKNGRGAI